MRQYYKITYLVILFIAVNLLSKETIATIGNKNYFKKEFEQFVLNFVYDNDTIDAAYSSIDRRRELLHDMINFELIAHLADSLQLDTMRVFKEKYQRRLKAVGKRHHLLPDSIRRKVFSDEDIKNEYLKIKYRYKVKHIIINDNNRGNLRAKFLVDSIHKEILNNISSFSHFAFKFSEDIHSSKNGGDLGWIKLGNYIPEFEYNISSLDLGHLSRPFKTHLGWHIVYLQDKIFDKSVSSFEKETPEIVKMLKDRYQKEYFSANYSFHEFLFKKYNVIINYNNIDIFIKSHNTFNFDKDLIIAQMNDNILYSKDLIENIENWNGINFDIIHQLIYNHFAKVLTDLAVVDLGYVRRSEVINLAKEGMLIEYIDYFINRFQRKKDLENKWFQSLYRNFNVTFDYFVLENTFNYLNDDKK